MKSAILGLLFIAVLSITGCRDNERNLSPFEVYPSDLKSEERFGTQVAGTDDFMLVGTSSGGAHDVYVFKRSGEHWTEVVILPLNWIDFEISDDHAVASYFEGNSSKTAVYSLAGGEFTFQTKLDGAYAVAAGTLSIIIGPVRAWEADIYKEIAGTWELSGSIAMRQGSDPSVAIGENYAYAASIINTNYIVDVHRFEAGSWQLTRTITANSENFITVFEATDDYVAVGGKDGLEVFQIADAGAPSIIISKTKNYIAAAAIFGDRILVADYDLHFAPSQVSTATVRLYEINAGVASVVNTFVSDNGSPVDTYGQSLALSASYVYVGCPGDADAGHATGSVYFYKH